MPTMMNNITPFLPPPILLHTFRKSGKGLDLSSLFMLRSLESAFSQADIQMKDFKVIFNPNQL